MKAKLYPGFTASIISYHLATGNVQKIVFFPINHLGLHDQKHQLILPTVHLLVVNASA